MFFWKNTFHSLRRQVSKRLMIAATVFLGVGLTTSMFAVMLDIGDKMQAELSSFGANISVVPKGAAVVTDMYNLDDTQIAGYIDESEIPNLKAIFWGYNIEFFTPFLRTTALSDQDEVPVVGTWFDHQIKVKTGEELVTGIREMRDWWQVDGQWPTDQNQAMAGSRLARSKGWSLGDTVSLEESGATKQVTVSGIFNSGSDEDNQLFVALPIAQALAERPGQVERIEVRAITTPDNDLARRAAVDPSTLSLTEWETWYCTAYVSSIAYQIEESMTNVDASAIRQVADNEGVILEKTELIMTTVAIFAMIASSLGIANLVTASVMERSKEIGLMKALGARNRSIVAQIMTETLIIAGIGGVLGFVAGIGLAQLVGHLVFGSGIAVRPILIPLMVTITLATVIVGSLPAMRYLLRLRPATVLHGR